MINDKNLSNYLYKILRRNGDGYTTWVIGGMIWYCEGYQKLRIFDYWKKSLNKMCSHPNVKIKNSAIELKEKLKKVCPELE